ncbi:MAG: hypothetical protein J6S98_09385 [Lentisphaeria bacterium]|nr:hypothetical protein [Lentisphaeria bacterium]
MKGKKRKKEDFTFEIHKKSETAGRQICFAVSLGNQKKEGGAKPGREVLHRKK